MTEEANAVLGKLDEISTLLRALLAKQQLRPQRLLRISEAANYLRVSKWQLRNIVNRGEIPIVRVHDCKGHSPHVFDVHDLDAFVEKQKT